MDDLFKAGWLESTNLIPRPPAAVFFEQEHQRDTQVWELLSKGKQPEEVAEELGLTVAQVRDIEENWMEVCAQKLASQDVYRHAIRLLDKGRRIEQHATHLFLNRDNVRAGELTISALNMQAKILGLDKHTLLDRQLKTQKGTEEKNQSQAEQMMALAEAIQKRMQIHAPSEVRVDAKTQIMIPASISEKKDG